MLQARKMLIWGPGMNGYRGYTDDPPTLDNWYYNAAENTAVVWNNHHWAHIAEGEFTLEEAKQICEVHYATGA